MQIYQKFHKMFILCPFYTPLSYLAFIVIPIFSRMTNQYQITQHPRAYISYKTA